MTPEFRQSFLVRVLWIAIVIGIIAVLLPSPRSKDPGATVPLIVLETEGIVTAIEQYKARYGEYPAGDSRAIARALCGNNPQRLAFFEPGSGDVSADGDLLDPWGTPLQIYVSGNKILVRSAGPNKRFENSLDKDFDDFIRATDR